MEQPIVWVSAAIAILSLLAAILAWTAKNRWIREYREATDRLLEGKDREIGELEEQIEFLKEVESIKFTERYISTRMGLEERARRLEGDLQARRKRARELEGKIEDLSLQDDEQSAKTARLRSELVRTHREVQKLEEIMESVHSVAPIPVDQLKQALSARRRRSAELKGRIEHMTLDGLAKSSELEDLREAVERNEREARAIRHDIEVTRSAGPIVDAMLGITSEVEERIGRIGDRLGPSIRQLASTRGQDPVEDFLGVVEGGRSGRSQLPEPRRDDDGASAPSESEPASSNAEPPDATEPDAAPGNSSRDNGMHGPDDTIDDSRESAREPREPEPATGVDNGSPATADHSETAYAARERSDAGEQETDAGESRQ